VPLHAQAAPASGGVDRLLIRHGYVRVPVDPVPNRPGSETTVQLRFISVDMGDVPVTLLLDSGYWGNVVINKAMASVLDIRGVSATATASDTLAASRAIPIDTMQSPPMAVGSARVGPQSLAIYPRLVGMNGMLGASFLAAYAVVIDYPNNTFYLRPANAPSVDTAFSSADLARAMPAGYVAIPLTRVLRGTPAKGMYVLEATVDGHAVTLILDTGANQSVTLDDRRATALALRTTGEGFNETVSGWSKVRTGRLGRLAIGGFGADSVDFDVWDMDWLIQDYVRDGFPRLDGVLGAQVLAAHGAIVDFGRNVLYLQK